MKTKNKITLPILILLLSFTGCTGNFGMLEETSASADIKAATEKDNNSSSDNPDDAKTLPDQEFSEKDYIQKNTIPVIKIDTLGYKNNDNKTAFFSRGEAGDIFYVVNRATRERVFQGKIKENGTGDFSEVTKEGIYFIEAAYIGRSQTFPVTKNQYGDVFEQLQNSVLAYADNTETPFEERIVIWDRLLQYYRDALEDSRYEGLTGESKEIHALKSAASTLIAESNTYKNNVTAYVEELAVYSASMAMFYRTVKEFDETAAAEYLAEAEDVYVLVESEEALLLDEAYLFYPAAALYCATGKAPYGSAVEDYLKENTERTFFEEGASAQALTADEMYLFGVMAYLNTTYNVDMNLCESLMENLTLSAESFADNSKADNFYCVAADCRSRLLADRLYVIAVVEHVIVSREYTNIVKNAIHYLGGCNEMGSAYLSEYGVFDMEHDEGCSEAFLGSAYLGVLNMLK